MFRKYLLWGISLAGFSVILGAFGAHGLKSYLPVPQLAVFETGVRYAFLHALALILLASQMQHQKSNPEQLKRLQITGNLFVAGILIFSGSLYTLALQPIFDFNYTKLVGPITPFGGLSLTIAWAYWARTVYLNKVDN